MFNRTRKRSARAAAGSLRPRSSRVSRGQSTVEFALVSVLGLVVMMVGVQFALIGQVALSLSQGASALARYAAVNPGSFGTDNGTASLPSAASALLSPTINDSKLTVTIASYKGGRHRLANNQLASRNCRSGGRHSDLRRQRQDSIAESFPGNPGCLSGDYLSNLPGCAGRATVRVNQANERGKD